MYERLIESWLDSASERSYQASFCQMLNAQGYEILHSTRHSPIEFGKDVIAKASDGVLCAFQLKGNPNSRLTANQVREIQPQLIQLVSQPIFLSGVQQEHHKSYIVTNGEIDEEARRALHEIGEGLRQVGYHYPEINIVSRGTLLSWAKNLGSNLWPSELKNISHLLEILVEDGRKLFPINKLHVLLCSVLGLLNTGSKRPSANEVMRRINSSALLVGISLKNFNDKNNHYSAIIAWTLFVVYAMGACERYGISYRRNAMHSVEIAKTTIFDALCELCNELQERKHIVEGDAFTDTPFYAGRQLLLSALMALLWFWDIEIKSLSEKQKEFIGSFMPNEPQPGWLWGEGAVPQLLAYIWYIRATTATTKADMFLAYILRTICRNNISKKLERLASPYYSLEDVTNHLLRSVIGEKDDKLADENPINTSYSAEGLMNLLVRTNLKQTCKSIWPDYSQLIMHWFEPSSKWQYCLWRSEDGIERSKQIPIQGVWDSLVEEARDVRSNHIPAPLKQEKFILLLWTIIAPYRATSETIRLLGYKFNNCWFIPPPYT